MPAPLFSVTEMFTTAGSTRLTSGAKLCVGSIGSEEGAAGLFAVGGLSAQTSGGTTRAAPSVTPSAAPRKFFQDGRRQKAAGSCIIDHLLVAAIDPQDGI